MARPSPRTQGVTEEGETFQKFGTQQLEYIDPINPALGVKQINTGANFKGFTTAPIQAIKQITGIQTATPFSQQFQSGQTGAVIIPPTQPQGQPIDIFGGLFDPEPIDKHGCECEACKNGTGQCSDKNPKCNAWDLGCEVSEGVTDIVTKPAGDWWDKYGIWVYLILGVIGFGILLWLLRPIFELLGVFKRGGV